MKIAAFRYTDAKGKITSRQLLVTSQPTDKFSGIDVSSLNDEDVATFAVEYNLIHDEFIEKLEKLKEKYDLKHNYRQFFANKMEDFVAEEI